MTKIGLEGCFIEKWASDRLKVVCQWKNLNQPIPKLTNDQYGKHEQRLTY